MSTNVMINNEIVSVIIPSYNSQKVIQRSVDSALNQTYRNIEVWVVDDGSSDDTIKILNSYEDKRLNIIALPENTGSPVTPRNSGILKAKGKYVAFLDSDDYWAPNKLEIQITCMRNSSSSFSCTSYLVKDVDGFSHIRKVPPLCDFSDILILNTIGCSTVVVEKNLLSKYLFSHRRLEDYDLWLRILQDGNNILGVDASLTTYMKSDDSRSKFNFKQAIAYFSLFRRFGKRNPLQLLFHCTAYLIKRLVWAKL